MRSYRVMIVLFYMVTPYMAHGHFEQKPLWISESESSKRFAGDWSSGGGNAVVCFHSSVAQEAIQKIYQSEDKTIPNYMIENDYIKSVEMYDLFEAKLPRGFSDEGAQIISIREDESYSKYADRLAQRFFKVVPVINNTLKNGKVILPDSQFRYHSGALKQQNDIGDIALIDKDECVIQTIAAQRNWDGFFEVYLDARLFNHHTHSQQSKATLVIHEYIYAFSRKYLKHEDSSATRKIVESLITYHPDLTIDYAARLVYELGYGIQEERLNIPNEHIYETHLLFSPVTPYFNLVDVLSRSVMTYTNENVKALIRSLNSFLTSEGLSTYPKETPLHDVAKIFRYYEEEVENLEQFKYLQRQIDHRVEKMADELLEASILPRFEVVEQKVRESKYIDEETKQNVISKLERLFRDLKGEIADYSSSHVQKTSSIMVLSDMSYGRLFKEYKKILFHKYALDLFAHDLDQVILP